MIISMRGRVKLYTIGSLFLFLVAQNFCFASECDLTCEKEQVNNLKMINAGFVFANSDCESHSIALIGSMASLTKELKIDRKMQKALNDVGLDMSYNELLKNLDEQVDVKVACHCSECFKEGNKALPNGGIDRTELLIRAYTIIQKATEEKVKLYDFLAGIYPRASILSTLEVEREELKEEKVCVPNSDTGTNKEVQKAGKYFISSASFQGHAGLDNRIKRFNGIKNGELHPKKIVSMSIAAAKIAKQLAEINGKRLELAIKRIEECDTNLRNRAPDLNLTMRKTWEAGVDFSNQGCITKNGVADYTCKCKKSGSCLKLVGEGGVKLPEFNQHTHARGDSVEGWKTVKPSGKSPQYKPNNPIFTNEFKSDFNGYLSFVVKNVNQMMKGELDTVLTETDSEKYFKYATDRIEETNKQLKVPIGSYESNSRFRIEKK